MQEHKKIIFLSVLSGLLLWLAWPVKPLGLLLHIAFVPLLLMEHQLQTGEFSKKSVKFFSLSYLAMLLWNLLSTWWIYNASAGGGIFAIIANAFLMTVPLMLFYFTKKICGRAIGYSSFVVYWLGFEYFHLTWDLSWPWLTLGNGFASLHQLVQWYEYTGHLGGSLWVMVSNLLVFLIIVFPKMRIKVYGFLAAWLIAPIAFSLYIYASYVQQGTPVEVVVVQPNIDPYEEKFESGNRFMPFKKQLQKLMDLTDSAITENTRFVAWPETAMPYGYWEKDLTNYELIKELFAYVEKYPQVSFITGLDTYKSYPDMASPTARFRPDIGYYDAFNAALMVDHTGEYAIYHKSKLVPGVEYIPPVIANMAIDLGGIVGSLGRQPDRVVFHNHEKIGAAPVICYESIFGEFVTQYVKKGANFITIITNDGWWGNTGGHRQHLEYGKLRSIETRKDIARSANTGISGFISQRGDIVQRSEYWVEDVLRGTVMENDIQTFYVRNGDYIGKAAKYFSWLMMLWLAIASIFFRKNRKKRNKNAIRSGSTV